MNRLLALAIVCSVAVIAAQEPLNDAQVNEAIALGNSGNVPIVHVGKFFGDFDIFIEGPVARIAAAAAAATKQYRPFDRSKVTRDMAAGVYTIHTQRSQGGQRGVLASHIVLQPKGAKGMDGVIQPLTEGWDFGTLERFPVATFDRFPEGDFQVLVVTGEGPQRYIVTDKDRAKIR